VVVKGSETVIKMPGSDVASGTGEGGEYVSTKAFKDVSNLGQAGCVTKA